MTQKTISARERALQLLEEALATGVRHEFRTAIEAAIANGKKLESKPINELNITVLRNLANGGRIADSQNAGLWFQKGRKGCVAVYRYRSPEGQQRELCIGTWSEDPDKGFRLAEIRSTYETLRAQVPVHIISHALQLRTLRSAQFSR